MGTTSPTRILVLNDSAFKRVTEQTVLQRGIGLPGRAWAADDLIWSADMILWILTALTWAPIRLGEWGNRGPLGDATVRHTFVEGDEVFNA